MNVQAYCPFISKNSPDQRKAVSAQLVEQYPERIPVVVVKYPGARVADLPEKRTRLLAPADITIAKFVSEMRKSIQLGRLENLFVYVGDSLVQNPNLKMSQLYAKHKNDDGFLYVVYSDQSVLPADRNVSHAALSRMS